MLNLLAARIGAALTRDLGGDKVVPWGRRLIQVAELVGGDVAGLITRFLLLEESVPVSAYFFEVLCEFLARHGFEVRDVWLPPMFWALCLRNVVGVGGVLGCSEPRLVGRNFELAPVLDPQRLWLCRVPFCLVLWGIDALYSDVGPATAEREGTLEAPVATVGITAVRGVDLADARVERGEFGVFEECAKGRAGQCGGRHRVCSGASVCFLGAPASSGWVYKPAQAHARPNDVQITVCPRAQCSRKGWMVQTNVEDECLGSSQKQSLLMFLPLVEGLGRRITWGCPQFMLHVPVECS